MTLDNMGYERRLQALERFAREIRGDRGATAPAAWTPQLYQNGNITSTNTVSRYSLIGNLAFVQFRIVATAAGTAGQAIEIRNIPVTPLYGANLVGAGVGAYKITGSTVYICSLQMNNTGPAIKFLSDGVVNYIGITPSFAISSGDSVEGVAIYEI